MESNENLLGIINALYKKRKAIIGFSLATAILTALLSLAMSNYYQASTIFYAASPDLGQPSPLGNSEKKMDYYGTSDDMDRLFSIAQSSELKQSLIKQFDLYKHYDINPEKKNAEFNIIAKLNKAFTVEKTKYDAFNLGIEDKNPELSRDMVNFARDYIDTKGQSLIKDTQKKLIISSKAGIDQKKIDLIILNHTLDSLRTKFEIFDTKNQGQIIAEQLTLIRSNYENLNSRIESYKSAGIYRDSIRILGYKLKGVQGQLDYNQKIAENFSKGISIVTSAETMLDEAINQLSIDQERYKLLDATFKNKFDAVHVVEYATTPLRKSRPKRSILVISAGIAAFIFSSLAAIVLGFYKKVNWSEVFKDDE